MLPRRTAPAVLVAFALVLAACGGSAEDAAGDGAAAGPATAPAPAATPGPDPAGSGSGEDASGGSVDLVEHLREKTMRMWEAYNTHDPDALEAFYEAGYWLEEEEEIRSNMQPFRAFGVGIEAEETSPPTEIAPGRWEIRHTGRFPLGSVKMIFIWEEFEGEWLLTHAEPE